MAVCATIIRPWLKGMDADSGPVVVIFETEIHLKSFSGRASLLELYVKHRVS